MCVCVCEGVGVCVYVTLSVNSPTGQTPQRIFTVDSLTDADLRKDMPFVGLDDELSHLGVQSPAKKNHFRGLNRHFKPNMWNNLNTIYSDLCIRLTGSCGQQQRLRGWFRMVVKQFQDGERPPF